MSDLRAELESVLTRLHDAIEAADADAVDACVVTRVEGLDDLAEYVPRPGGSSFVGIVSASPRRTLYGVKRADEDEVDIATFFRGRDGQWRLEPSGMSIGIEDGQSALDALQAYAAMAEVPLPSSSTRKWAPIPEHAGLDGILSLALAAAPIAAADVDAAERALGFSLPADYRAYVTTLGAALDTNFARIYAPTRASGERNEWRRRIDAYWLWADASDGFGSNDAYESVVLADTLGGDELLWSPTRNAFYVLPRNANVSAHLATPRFLDALAWMIEGPDLGGNQPVRYAEPMNGLKPAIYETPPLDDDEMEKLAVQAVAALRALDPKAQVIEADDEDGGWTVLLPTFGGSAFVFALGDVSLKLDPSLPASSASAVDAALTALSHTRTG